MHATSFLNYCEIISYLKVIGTTVLKFKGAFCNVALQHSLRKINKMFYT